MKVGGNESATKFFQSNGGSAALASKDAKVKYTSNAATKYKEELKKRAARDAEEFPEEVVITDIATPASGAGAETPTGNGGDDFFSSWDKPTIKRPSNPPSRTGTPPVVSRTGSPFLGANSGSNGATRPKSPLVAGEGQETAAPTVIRSAGPSAVRKGPTATAAKKTNILGAKKKPGLGAKKVVGEEIDFEAAEKKAKEEAERIEKLGYDPEAEKAEQEAATRKVSTPSESKIVSPTPVSPARNASQPHQRTPSEIERLGMGFGRLGFGQVGAAPKPAPAKKLGFGAVGASKAVEDESEDYARQKFGTQKSISSDEFFGREAYDPAAQAEAKTRLGGFEGASAISSNAYFGRPEEDDAPEGDYGDLETAAKDMIRRFGITAGDDLENLTQVLGEGSRKLQGAIRNYLSS